MRRVQRPKMISSLNDEAIKAVSVIPQNDTFYLNHKYFDIDSLPTNILEQLQCETNESQIEFSRFSKNIRLVEEAVLVEANRIRLDFHNFNKQTIEKILYKIRQTPSKDSQNYIRNLLTVIEIEFIRDEASAKTRKISSLNKALSQLIKDTTTNYHDLSKIRKGDFLFIFSCSLCNCKMRIKEKKLAKVKCSKCEYQFIVDTRVEESSSKKLQVGKRIQELSTKTQKAFNKLLIKIRSVFP